MCCFFDFVRLKFKQHADNFEIMPFLSVRSIMVQVGIVGATGYTGSELIRLLLSHSSVQIECVASRSNHGTKVSEFFPQFAGLTSLEFEPIDMERLKSLDVVFFATPHGVAMQYAPKLTSAGVLVVDLAADYRIKDAGEFTRWYAMEHSDPAGLASAVYGLSEVNREALKSARLIANPGCYPTTALLGLYPLAVNQLHPVGQVIIDAKSGVSGAGKKVSESNLYTEVTDSFKAYGLGGHRHQPEIVDGLRDMGLKVENVRFTPHLVPMVRGMLSTIYVTLSVEDGARDIHALYRKCYKDEAFIDVLDRGQFPETRSVRGSNRLKVGIFQDKTQLTIVVVQDNLVKGAAGQAVQNMNLALGLNESLGVSQIPLSP